MLQGELSKSEIATTIFTNSNSVTLTRESEDVLEVGTIGRNWRLFDHDCIRVGGLLGMDGLGNGHRLFDPDGSCSIALSMDGLDPSKFVGETVIVTGIVIFDQRTLSLTLSVRSLTADF
jgi:hypothetical protein